MGRVLVVLLINLCGTLSAWAAVNLESPRATLKSFYEAMQVYRQGVTQKNSIKKKAIEDAMETLHLDHIIPVLREEKGREAAIYLKEAMDRISLIDWEVVPSNPEVENWTFPNSEIKIVKVRIDKGSHKFLFSESTVSNASRIYRSVRHLKYVPGSGKGAKFKESWQEKVLGEFGQESFLGLYVWQHVGLLVALLAGFIVKKLLELSLHMAEKVTTRSKNNWDDKILDAIASPVGALGATAIWYLSLYILKLEGIFLEILTFLLQGLLSFSFVWLAYKLVEVFSEFMVGVAQKTEFPIDDQLVPIMNRTLKVLVIVFGVLVTVKNFGVDVGSLLAGLGLGGLAFALAAKDMASNLFGSIMILFDKPFRIGDWVKVGSLEGTVEEIGLRSTRIRTFYDSLLCIPNSALANANIDNMGRRTYRRVVAELGVTYDTKPDTLEAFLEGIKNIIKANENTRKDYYHVVFKEYGACSLNIMLYFFLRVPDWSNELVEKQNVFLEVYRLADELGVEFAFPTQTLFVRQEEVESGSREQDINRLADVAKRFGPSGSLAKPGGQGVFTPPFKELS